MSAAISDDFLIRPHQEWSFYDLHRVFERLRPIAEGEFGLDLYPVQLEVISAEQMLDAYSSIGLPLMYRHWSFGKRFAREEALYRQGYASLAYEIVINSNPCLVYVMEDNSLLMQSLVIAHAAFGHNHFFKNNALFRQWTDASAIIPYMEFAKNYIAKCEERYGEEAVERVLDAAHALMTHGVDRCPRKKISLSEEEKLERERQMEEQRMLETLWGIPSRKRPASARAERQRLFSLPEENILYFLEKKAPLLKPWQREVLRIVRNIAQYFYPQRQTRLMNEGCATYVHYTLMNRLYEQGMVDDGAMLEFLHAHSSVITQPDYDHPAFSGINVYALGFAMMRDLARIAVAPTEEDRVWFPDIAGSGDPWSVLREAWANHRDESFIRQYLSPEVIRRFRLFSIADDGENDYLVEAIHDEQGYETLRWRLADHFDLARNEPQIEIVDVDLDGDRCLELEHRVIDGRLLDERSAKLVLGHLADLWGYEVRLAEIDAESDRVLRRYDAAPRRNRI
jgi:stage V sporulation protein R